MSGSLPVSGRCMFWTWTYIIAFERAAYASKSFIIALALCRGRLTAEQAAQASHVEVRSQIEIWGEVEDSSSNFLVAWHQLIFSSRCRLPRYPTGTGQFCLFVIGSMISTRVWSHDQTYPVARSVCSNCMHACYRDGIVGVADLPIGRGLVEARSSFDVDLHYTHSQTHHHPLYCTLYITHHSKD